ncbi:MAG: hypothetical protein AB1489_18870 [Acidobacteriota bacterium]
MEVTMEDGSKIICADNPIGGGTEGDVHLSVDGKYAIKLYHQPEPQRRTSLQLIINRFNPVRSDPIWQPLFCWPDAIVVAPSLGVRMPRAPAELRRLDVFLLSKFRNKRLQPAERGNWDGYLKIAIKMARLMSRLHFSGLCYADPSWNNFLVDPRDGQAVAIDVDGLVVPNFLPAMVEGTREFQAPELVLGTAPPSVQTDLHALAVLIYRTLMFHQVPNYGWGSVHPLGAGMSALQGSKIHPGMGEDVEKRSFGDAAVFIEHPTDYSNRPREQFISCSILGPDLQKLIKEVFVEGLYDPQKRPLAAQWEEALVQLYDRLIPCANTACEMKYFAVLESGDIRCPWCNTLVREPKTLAVLRMYRQVPGWQPPKVVPDGNYMIVAWPGRTIHDWHIDPTKMPGRGANNQPRAQFDFDDNTKRWYLVNNNIDELIAKDANGRQTISRGSSVELKNDLTLLLGRSSQSRVALVQILAL